jgi:hypothetical protein
MAAASTVRVTRGCPPTWVAVTEVAAHQVDAHREELRHLLLVQAVPGRARASWA